MNKVVAPGKLILSGEHSVVYGHPVLAMAINYHAETQIECHQKPIILFDLKNLNTQTEKTFSQIKENFFTIQERYQRYQQNELTIREVLQQPSDLVEYVLGLCLFKEAQFKLTLTSSIPVGCGIGSSAATILSSLYAVVNAFDLNFSTEQLFELALDAENKQHGKSSGIDLRISLQGGILYRENNQYLYKNKIDLPLYLINTGTPETTTGECVTHSKKFFENSSIGEDFAAVTRAMACSSPSLKKRVDAEGNGEICINPPKGGDKFYETIRQNHRLLVKIGVVPEKIQKFIQAIEAIHGAAKICGAGAIRGEKGGAVLVICEDESALQKICQQFHYTLLPLQCETRGLHVI